MCPRVVTHLDLFFGRLLENCCFVLLTNRAPPQISDNWPDMRQRASEWCTSFETRSAMGHHDKEREKDRRDLRCERCRKEHRSHCMKYHYRRVGLPETPMRPDMKPERELAYYRGRMLHAINKVRSCYNCRAVSINSRLNLSAMDHCHNMMGTKTFFHTSPDGTYHKHRMARRGYKMRWSGENVAMGLKSVTWCMETWMNSSTHRQVILAPRAIHVGIGMTISAKGWAYWVLNFGLPHK